MLTGKVAVVTGGARGNGEGIARVFAAEGATVCLWDVLDTGARSAEVLEAFGTVDILVNNAAIAPEVPFVEMSAAVRERVWRVNVDGAMNWRWRRTAST